MFLLDRDDASAAIDVRDWSFCCSSRPLLTQSISPTDIRKLRRHTSPQSTRHGTVLFSANRSLSTRVSGCAHTQLVVPTFNRVSTLIAVLRLLGMGSVHAYPAYTQCHAHTCDTGSICCGQRSRLYKSYGKLPSSNIYYSCYWLTIRCAK